MSPNTSMGSMDPSCLTKNGNTLCQYVIDREIAYINYFNMTKPLNKLIKYQDDHTYVPVQMFLDIKSNPMINSVLVAEGNMTGASDANYFCGVVNINNTRTDIFFGDIKC